MSQTHVVRFKLTLNSREIPHLKESINPKKKLVHTNLTSLSKINATAKCHAMNPMFSILIVLLLTQFVLFLEHC